LMFFCEFANVLLNLILTQLLRENEYILMLPRNPETDILKYHEYSLCSLSKY